jgi:2-succinyl-5-enolpyruvyl-6-hydroxy-3-cyclohexene-1-carboxylate synthase
VSATDLARAVLARLLAAGITEYVLAPGSRNAPLAFALADAAEAGLIRLHTRIDERTAGFLALGLTKVGARAAVVCTSGTAVANLHPAVLESAHSGLGTVFVTADRPASLRGTGASQTTDQVGLFGDFAAFADLAGAPGEGEVLDVLLAERDRPVHLNVQFSGLLVPSDRVEPPAPGPARWPARAEAEPYVLPRGPRTVVVAADDAGPPARILAETAGWPLLAEPSSGSRTGTHAVRTYRLLLDSELGAQVERVVLAGHPTLSRPVAGLLAREDVEVVSLPARGCWPERPFPVAVEASALTVAGEAGERERAWLRAWRDADAVVSRRLDALLAAEPDLTPHEVARAVAQALPEGGLLWVGASNPIRDLDLVVPRYEPGRRRKVIANRGLAGIDGTLSSAIGAALGRPHSSRAFALVGDVTFVHDLTGLVIGPYDERPDLTVVVVNDDGGSIFSTLEQGAPAYADRYDRLFGTPHGVDLASVCAANSVPHLRVASLPELEQALGTPNGGIEVVEAIVRRDNRRELDARIRGLVDGVSGAL